MNTMNNQEVPDGYVLLQRHNNKAAHAACMDGGRFHGWLFAKGPDGQWVSQRKLESWEVMQVEDQRDDGIVQETSSSTPSAGSATSIDLAKIKVRRMFTSSFLDGLGRGFALAAVDQELLKEKADVLLDVDRLDDRRVYEVAILPVAEYDELIALARATPQHPDPIGYVSKQTLETLRGPDLAPDEHVRLWHAENPPSRATIPVYLAATPQHSVTEQASMPGDWQVEFDAYSAPGTIRLNSPKWGGCFLGAPKRGDIELPALVYHLLSDMLAQPLASTAATQPEQASDFAVRFIEQRAQKYLDENAHSDWDTGSVIFNCGEAGQDYYNSLVELADDIRAALAIPASGAPTGNLLSEILVLAETGMCHGLTADDYCSQIVAKLRAAGASTAASEQQAGAIERIADELDQEAQAYEGDFADVVRGCVESLRALSGRATIPSEADERALFDAYMKTPAPDDYDASVKDAWLIWQEAWRAALTHRATTAADQQGDTAMEMMCNPAWGEPDLHARLVRFCRTELPLAQRQSKVQEWVEAVASTTAYMARDFGYREDPAQQGAAQAQAGDARAPDGWVAVALICGEPTSVAFRDEDAARAVCIEGVPFPFVRVSTKESA